MYAQITTRCNMTCAHCGFDCTADGEDMSLDVFRQVVDLPGKMTIGGGEPTLHPLFWEFLELALSRGSTPGLATNGSMTDTAIRLAELARQGIICCALSRDKFHDPIDPRVIEAFDGAPQQNGYPHVAYSDDYRVIRDVANGLVNSGRCDFGQPACLCPGLFIKPSGDIRACGCTNAPSIGCIQTGYYKQTRECHNSY